MQKHFKAAIDQYSALIELDSQHLESYLTLRSDRFRDIGKLIESAADLDKALSVNPSAGDYFKRARLYELEGNFKKAIEYLSLALDKDTKYSGAFSARGKCFARINKMNNAIADLTHAISLEKDERYTKPDNYVDRGFIYLTNDRLEEAKADFEKAIELKKKRRDLNVTLDENIDVYYGRAILNFRTQKYDDALDDYLLWCKFQNWYSPSLVITGTIVLLISVWIAISIIRRKKLKAV
ncbi:MAG: hypothetical protein IPG59_01760 [Candidatus Melainabacteria bacterium]|nr:MAG: hypothetical protein IPG59_01760 [Candidatus Melainabacteria bacterium]